MGMHDSNVPLGPASSQPMGHHLETESEFSSQSTISQTDLTKNISHIGLSNINSQTSSTSELPASNTSALRAKSNERALGVFNEIVLHIQETLEGKISLEDKARTILNSSNKMIALSKILLSSEQVPELERLASTIDTLNNFTRSILEEDASNPILSQKKYKNLHEIYAKLGALNQKVSARRVILSQKEMLYSNHLTLGTTNTETLSLLTKSQNLNPAIKSGIEQILTIHHDYGNFRSVRDLIRTTDSVITLITGAEVNNEMEERLKHDLIEHASLLRHEIENASIRQKELLEDLNTSIDNNLRNLLDPIIIGMPADHILQTIPQRLLISLQQMICSPIDWKFNPMLLLPQQAHNSPMQKLLAIIIVTAEKNQLSLDKFLDKLIYSDHVKDRMSHSEIIQLKRENILLIASKYTHGEEGVPQKLILGSGPGGLIRALKSIQMNQTATIIERRPADRMFTRDNIIVLGGHDNGDIDILKHFGITDQMAAVGDGGTWLNNSLTISIGLLEQHMNNALIDLNEMCEEDLISTRYNSYVKEIIQNDGNVIFTIQSGEDELFITNPDEVIVAEGAHSYTRDLLGIGSMPTSKMKKIAVNFFHHTDPSWFSRISHSFGAVLDTTPLFTKYLKNRIWKRNTEPESAKILLSKVSSILLKTPETDYIYSYLPPRLIKRAKDLDATIERIDRRLNICDEVERKKLLKKKELLFRKRKALLGGNAAKKRNYWETLYSFLGPQLSNGEISQEYRSMSPVKHDKSYFVDVQVSGASAIGAKIGPKTSVILVGDALQTTDPITGTGCSTAIASAKISVLSDSPLALEFYGASITDLKENMIETAFDLREYSGIRRTELLERYTEIAVSEAILSREDADFLHALILRSKNVNDVEEMRYLTDEEVDEIARIKQILDINFQTLSGKTYDAVEEFKRDHIGHDLHTSERRVARDLASSKAITVGNTNQRDPQGWYLGIYLGLDHIEKSLLNRGAHD